MARDKLLLWSNNGWFESNDYMQISTCAVQEDYKNERNGVLQGQVIHHEQYEH